MYVARYQRDKLVFDTMISFIQTPRPPTAISKYIQSYGLGRVGRDKKDA